MCYCPTPTLHLNLALTGDSAFIFSLKKTHSVWFISVLNYVLINHLLLVIPMSYPCHYTNLCPHKPHKHAHTHTHTHTHTTHRVETSLLICILALCLAPLYHCQSEHAAHEDLLMDNHRIQIHAPGLYILHLYKHIHFCSWQEGYLIFQGFQACDSSYLVMWQ